MSANVISGFLPWTVEFVKSNARSRQIWDYIFPPEVLEICPAPFHHISIGENVVSIRWPLVAIFCAIGFLGGISLGAKLLYSQRTGSGHVSGYFMWGCTFIWYGFMCLGALFTHSIQTSHAQLFYLLDVVATGCTGVSSVGGFLSVWGVIDDRRVTWQILAASLYSILSFLALTTTSPMVRDMVYVLPTIACVLFLTHQRMSFRRKALAQKLTGRPDDLRARAAEKGLDIGVIGASLAAGSVVADRWLCHTLGSHGGFLVWVFIGCDISLFGAYKFITTLRSLPPASGVKSKAV